MKFFNDLKLKNKIQLSFMTVSLLMILIYSVSAAVNTEKAALQQIDVELKTAMFGFVNLADDVLHSRANAGEKLTIEESRSISIHLTEFANNINLPYVYSFVKKGNTVYYAASSFSQEELADSSFDYWLTPYDESSAIKVIKEVFETGEPKTLEYSSQYGEFRTYYGRFKDTKGGYFVVATDADLGVVKAARNKAILQAALLGFVSIFITFLFSFLLSNVISKPILALQTAVRELADGKGDLTKKIPVYSTDESGMIASDFNAFIEHLREMFIGIYRDSNSLSDGLGNITTMMNEMNNDALNQSEKAITTAATIEEITATMNNIADSTSAAAVSVQQANDRSRDSADTVEKVANEINNISLSVADLSIVITTLQSRSKEISEIIGVIKAIADQTNLLALNAAIEAARAGDTGRGFAVVADEVRTLAGRTAQATLQISEMINSIVGETDSATNKMIQTTKSVDTGVGLSKEALVSIVAIRGDMDAVVETFQVINQAVTEQSIATSDMARAAESISLGSQQSRVIIESTNTTTRELDSIAKELNGAVTMFKL